jgi:hypothetical protein
MDRHEQRRAALPHDEDDLRVAFFDGRLDERVWCELKRELPPPSRGVNLELARDLASLAVDGGSLYIGVDEKAPDGDPLRPQALAGLRERVDQVGQSRVTPALFVESYEIPASGQPGHGYLEVVVRASADAPHQVDGIYYGRSDTGKCRLPDQQVERLMRGREQQRHGAGDALHKLIAADPYQRPVRAHPHLFAFARPGVRRTEMCRDVIGAGASFGPLISLRTRVVNDVVRPLYSRVPQAPGSVLEALMNPQLISGGAAMTSLAVQSSAGERHHQELRIDEDGDLSLYHACVGWDGDPLNGVPRKVLSAPKVVGALRELIALAAAISHCTRIPGSWHIGVALTGIYGYRHQESSWPDYGPPCTDDEYVRVEHFNLAAMERTPGDIAYKLLGRLLRALRADADPAVKALLTDSEAGPAGGNLHDEEN